MSDFEPNDSIGNAQFLNPGTYGIQGVNSDFFAFQADPGPLSLTMTPAAGTDVNMILYNSSQQIIGANFGPGAESISFLSANSDTFYVQMFPTVGSTSNYTLNLQTTTVNYPFEPNDSKETARDLGEGSYTVNGKGEDWYRIPVNPGKVNLALTPLNGNDVNMVLYNSAMQVVGANFGAGTETISHDSNSTEFYFLKVFPTASNASSYKLDIDLPQNSWAQKLNFGPINNASIGLFDIDDDGKDEIIVGTSKLLDAQGNETLPAGLIVLEDDGSIKWTLSFPAMTTPDPKTGKIYNTTSVSTAPTFSDLNGDGNIDIIVGVGGDTLGELNDVGQPGDRGGVYAIDPNGQIMWFHESRDILGNTATEGDGRPDGVHGAPVVFDIDRDGAPEVIYTGWDQRLWSLDGRTGTPELEVLLLDTSWSSPRVADINGDNIFEILVTADITENPDAGTVTGGLFHVFSADGSQNLPGWNAVIGNPNYPTLRGKYEEQVLWSSPITADLEGDGTLEILYGTGNFFQDQRGSYIRVWNHDGTEAFKLDTNGKTFATPLVADINADGRPEIVATTLDGYVHAWNYLGQPLFATQTRSFGSSGGEAIFSSPVAVDLNGDGKMEIMYAQGPQLTIVDSNGRQINDASRAENIFQRFTGSVAVKDINDDGRLEIISGGTDATRQQAIVYRWDNPANVSNIDFVDGRYQISQSNSNIDNFVERFYSEILGRTAEPRGLHYWSDSLYNGTRAGADVARGFIFSLEFMNRNLSDSAFVETLYRAFFDRSSDAAGANYWMTQLAAGASKEVVLNGFINSAEFFNLTKVFSIKPSM